MCVCIRKETYRSGVALVGAMDVHSKLAAVLVHPNHIRIVVMGITKQCLIVVIVRAIPDSYIIHTHAIRTL